MPRQQPRWPGKQRRVMRIRVAPKGWVERVDQRVRLGGILSPVWYSVAMISYLLGLLLKNDSLSASPGARASQTLLRFFRFLRYNGSLGHAFVLHQRFELRQGELQNLNCLLQLRRHHELLTQPKVMSEFYFQS